jgi:hypothetical protein
VRTIDESENMMPDARKQMIDELGLLRGNVLTETEKKLTKLASRKYEVVYVGVELFASSDVGSKVNYVMGDESTVTVIGTQTVRGVKKLLTEKGWANITDADGDVQLKAVSEIDTVALLAGVEKAAASIDLLNTDYGRLKADSVAFDFREFLEKIHITDIVREAGMAHRR